jgi:hypothetical protein
MVQGESYLRNSLNYGKKNYTTIFKTACYWRIYRASLIQLTISLHIPLGSVLMLFFHLHFELQKSLVLRCLN